MESGIYCFENLINGKKYIGQTKNLESRKSSHLSALNSKTYNDSECLQLAWNKYREENFTFYVIEECPIEVLDEREIFWIKELRSHITEHGYNIQWGGEYFMRGVKLTEEHKNKISASLSGENHPLFGKHLTEEHKKKISDSGKGRVVSDETREKMKNNTHAKGYRHTEEQRQKIGMNNSQTKLNAEKVLEILDLHYNNNLRHLEIAERYDVHYTTVSNIIHGKTWNFVYKQFMQKD